MALFRAADILDDKETQGDIVIAGFKNGETGESIETVITVKTSATLVEEIMDLADICVDVQTFNHRKGKHKGQTEVLANVNHKKFVKKTLESVYVKSSGDVLDEHSLEAILALAKRFPNFLEDLSDKLLNFYKSGQAYQKQEEAEDEKN